MFLLASPVVDTSALWKIIIASLAGGAGVAIAFGIAVYGLSRAQDTNASGSAKALNYALMTAAGLFCVLALVLGVYAMTQKS